MVEVRCFVATDDLVGLLESVDDGELISRDGSRIVGRLDSGLYAHLSGAFDFSSRPAFLASPLTRIEVTEDAEGRVPLISITGIEGRMRDLEIGLETLFAGRDRISGSSGDDVITFLDYPSFGIGDDTLRGGDGDDVLHGGLGKDRLFGDAGNDLLYLGSGKDRATGGAGADVFVFLNGSRGSALADFSAAAGDRLVLLADQLFSDPEAVRADPEGFVRLLPARSGARLQLDANGGGDRFVTWATITGDLGSTDLDTLIAQGTLVIA
ncbi:MAG: hypothetical protein RMK73_09850 [Geminicoccaceae bacterium]|nr:hypothetical protein [Geminicoccaceae bacterium]